MAVPSRTSMPLSRTRSWRVVSIWNPVASPPAWTIRGIAWAASRPSAISPSTVSKGTPSRTRSAIRSEASRASTHAALRSTSPAPALTVSRKCRRGESPLPIGAAIPPWA